MAHGLRFQCACHYKGWMDMAEQSGKDRGLRAGCHVLCVILLGVLWGAKTLQAQPFDAPPTLLLNEILPHPESGAAWLELRNPTNRPIALAGWVLQFGNDRRFDLPASLPPVPPEGLVLIHFGAAEAAVRAIPGGMEVLSATPAHWNAEAGAVILTGPEGQTDAVIWGDAEPAGGVSAPARLRPEYGSLPRGFSFPAGDLCLRIPDEPPSLNGGWTDSGLWACRPADSASPGAPNPLPGPLVLRPADGTTIAATLGLAVIGLDWAERFTFQLARDSQFSDRVVEQTVEHHALSIPDLPAGDYYWRVRGEGSRGVGRWSNPRRLTRKSFDLGKALPKSGGDSGDVLCDEEHLPITLESEQVVACNLIGLELVVQHKDTRMVCLDKCGNRPPYHWDQEHDESLDAGGHNDHYCTRASLAMIANHEACPLSQDRISYYMFEEAGAASEAARDTGRIGDPRGDLGHGLGTPDQSAMLALDWIYGQPRGSSFVRQYSVDLFDDGDPTDTDSIREFIDDGRAVLYHNTWHSTAVDGYAVVRREEDGGTAEEIYYHVLDPGAFELGGWNTIEAFDDPYLRIVFPPREGVPIRCDEPEVYADTDGDGLVDFDETERLHTDPRNPDTDGDGLPDKIDMLGYLFLPDGTPSWREPDIDEDGRRKELDPDNDKRRDNGVGDGCEDADLDGFFTPGGTETDNFDGTDDAVLLNPRCYSGYLRVQGEAAVTGMPGASTLTREEIELEPRRPHSNDEYAYEHRWSIDSGPISIPMFGGSITSQGSGDGAGQARVRIEIDEEGQYRIVTDTRPRIGAYAITTTAPGMAPRIEEEDFHFAFGDHHFEYLSPDVPPSVRADLEAMGPGNVFEGVVETTEDGRRRLAGQDRPTIPNVGVTGQALRRWEIWLDPPRP